MQKHLFPNQLMGMLSSPPTVADVAPSSDGTGLRLEGWLATWDTDSENETWAGPEAFTKALPSALERGVPVLYNHDKNGVVLGVVESAELRPQGLWGTVLLPRPEGGKALEIFNSVRTGLLNSFSLGGLFSRFQRAGRTMLMLDRWTELSLVPVAASVHTRVGSVQSVSNVKSLGGGVWVPETDLLDHAAHRRMESDLGALRAAVTLAEIDSLHERSFFDGY